MTREYLGTLVTFVFLILGVLLCFTNSCSAAWEPAAERAMRKLCPRQMELAPAVASVARRQLLHPGILVAKMKAESLCGRRLENLRTGALGVLQIMPEGSANPRRLPPAELLEPRTNFDLGARHLNRYLMICGTLGGAVKIYHGYKKCRGWRHDSHVKKVLHYFHSIFQKGRAQ